MTHAFTLLLGSPVLVAVVLIAGIGGTFQYGFNISVLTSPSVYIKELVNRTCVERYGQSLEAWELSLIWSFTVSMYCIGGLFGSLGAGHLAAAYGRKRCLLLNNVVAICGAVLMLLSKTAQSFEMIMAARFIYGINAGVALTVHTMYVLECTPKRLRGMVGVSIAGFVSLGKFFGQLLGISEVMGTEDRWPFLLAFSGVVGFLQLATLPFLPESPRYLLLERGDRQGCEKALQQLLGPGGGLSVEAEVEDMQAEHSALRGVKSHSVLELLTSRSVRWQLLTVIITFTTLQLCGINAVYLYSFDVFRAAGIPDYNLRYAALGTGLCEICTTVACGIMIESSGKRVLLIRGYLGMAAALLILTITLYLQTYVSWMPYCSMVLIFTFIFFFSSGPAGVTAPLPGEIFSQSYKGAGFVVACTLNWAGLFFVGMVFPLIVEHLEYFCFLIFFFFCFCSGVFVWYAVPETRNRSAIEISAEFDRMHSKGKTAPESKTNTIYLTHTQTGQATKL
ncbi:solute carrier family 2, facilitated glucose transporter member 11-like [Astyanax mexicanus]|uniref:Solute carrier family 2, facilitated glucose transporter member 5 n=2 Tax=Astyanax mexicanus TaxID=7994 RepID=A0A8T2KUT2_ASTMX|nr:solute carrier family 2, facilitated glucose transporter member 11-like [Astyanax mexicanus]